MTTRYEAKYPGSVVLRRPLWEASVGAGMHLRGCTGVSHQGVLAIPWLAEPIPFRFMLAHRLAKQANMCEGS